jgi:hypothetical protein
MKLLTLALAATTSLAAASTLHAQSSYPSSFSWIKQSSVGLQPIPTTTAKLSSSGVVYLAGLHLSDPTGAAVTVTIYDGTTAIYTVNLGGSNPNFFDNASLKLSPVSIAGNISWKASVANTALGHLIWEY